MPKRSVPEGRVTDEGIEGDRQRDRRFHGGRDRAVCVYARELIAALQAEGHPIDVGSTGENLTVEGLDWSRLVPGVTVRVGAVHLQVTRYASPCTTIAGSFRGGDFKRIAQKTNPGWSRVLCRVVEPGMVRVGEPVHLGA